MVEGVQIHQWIGQGYQPLVFSDGWMAALLNWEPIMNLENAKEIERHRRTDEVFVLFNGHAALYVTRGDDLQVVDMQPGLIYNVTKDTWHNLLATNDVKLLIVENRNTHLEDSETRSLNSEEILALRNSLPTWVNNTASQAL